MNDETKKKILLFGGFGFLVAFMVIYYMVAIGGDDSTTAQVAEMNATFSVPDTRTIKAEYDKKRDYYKKLREGTEEEQKFGIRFQGQSASPDSLAFVTEEERQQYIIDSLKAQLAAQEAAQANTQQTKPVVRQQRPVVRTQKPVVVQEEPKEEEDRFANFDLNRTSNPLDNQDDSRTETFSNDGKYYAAKFVENTTIVIGENQSINIRNTEKITLRDGTVIPRNTVMKGILSDVGNRLQIRVNQVETFDGTINAQLSVVHSDFQEGLPLRSSSEMSEQSQNKINEALNNAGSAATVNIPFINTPISLAPRFGNDTRERIYVPASMTFKLRVIHQ